MTGKTRKQYSGAQNIALLAQVESVCPLCGNALFNKKRGKSFKAYEIAHIYPLNPTPEEVTLLQHEAQLGNGDLNHEDNVIPLCLSCHGQFDNPRTVVEYKRLLEIKKRLIEKSRQEGLWSRYFIEEDIRRILTKLYSDNPIASNLKIEYDPKTLDRKFDGTITLPTARKIKNNVSDYYPWLSQQMENLDKSNPEASQLISLQFKGFYVKQKQLGITQQAIFENIVRWVNQKVKPQSIDAAEIITSFFVQNCEVLE